MKKSVLLSILLSPFLLALTHAQNNSRDITIDAPEDVSTKNTSLPEDVQEMQGVYYIVPKTRSKNPIMAVGVKGAFFIDYKNLLTEIEPYSWLVAPRGEIGLFADFYAGRFFLSTLEIMYARDVGYTTLGELLEANSVSFNALLKLRAPIVPRFALTAGVGLFSSIGSVSTDFASEGIRMSGLLAEFAVETSIGDRNQHVLTLGVRNKWRLRGINDVSQTPVGLMGSYAFRW